MRRARLALGVAAVAAGVAGFYALYFGSLGGFVVAIDECDRLFCDFASHFYPVGASVFSAGRPVEPFVYPAFAAVLFGLLGRFAYPTAEALWAGFQVAAGLALLLLARPNPRRDGAALTLAYVLVFLTSVPLLHNAKWGQVSVAITAGVLGCFALYRRGHPLAAALLLAVTIAIKIYPGVFLLYFALRRDWRFVANSVGAALAFLVLVPLVLLGPEAGLRFQLESWAWIAHYAPVFVSQGNTQFAGAAAARVLGLEFRLGSPQATALSVLCYALALLNAVGIWRLHRCSLPPLDTRTVAILFLMQPLLMPVTWPHYMVYLPFCQLVLVRLALGASGALRAAALSSVAVSVALASVFAYAANGHWQAYARRGFLAWADLALLLGYWIEAAPALRARVAAGRP